MKGERVNTFQKLKLSQPYLVAITVGVLLGSIALVPMLNKKVIEDDVKYIEIKNDVIYMEVNPSKLTDNDHKEIEQIVSENPGKDIIFAPGKGYKVPSPEERRRIDEESDAQERAAYKAWEEEQRAKGLIVDEPVPPCATVTVQTPIDKPSRFIMCKGEIIALPSKVSPPIAPVYPAKVLKEYLTELFNGISKKEHEEGYWSIFSDPKTLNSITFNNGDVVIDFNKRILQDIGGSESYIVITMLNQIHNTLFQFDEVKSVTLTLDGDCNAIGDVLQTGCLTYTRDMWEFSAKMNEVNLPPIYSLEGR